MNSFSSNRNGGFGNQGPQAPNLLDMFTGLVGGLLGGGGPRNEISMSLPFREAPRKEEQPGRNNRPGDIWGRQDDDLDPGFIGSMGPGTAIPLPQYGGVGDSDAIIKPLPMPDRYAGEAHNWLATGEPLRPHDWLQRDEPVHPFYKDQPQSSSPQNPSGPAKASQFRDPRTGKFDYWGWLDAGMANLGKGGTLFEDDTPDVNAREGILDKPAAMTAAGASENSRMPEESRFEARGAEQGYGLGRPVAYAAQDGGGDAPADGGGAGSGASAGQGQWTPAQQAQQPQQPFGDNTIRKEKQRRIDERTVRESESGPMNEPYDPESVAVRGRGGEPLSPELKERIRARLKGTAYENMDLDSLKLYRGRTPWYMPSDKEGITLENHIYMKDGKFAPEMDDYHFNLLVEEVVHAGQFQDKMTRPGYLWESLKNGYWKNDWEVEAREIAYPEEAQGQTLEQNPVAPRKPIEERNINK